MITFALNNLLFSVGSVETKKIIKYNNIKLRILYKMKVYLKSYYTRGTFWLVPTRRIRLSFVKCAYSDLRDIFFS